MDEDDIEYWKEKALAAEEELRDHQETSAELEAELERELKEKEDQLKTWQQKFSSLDTESERTIERLTNQFEESSGRLERLEKDYSALCKTSDYQASCIRELEQSVDDLERAKRQALATISVLENDLADQMENCAILEADLEQKAKLEDECQRLRDQARDLDNDLNVEKKKKTSFNDLIATAHQNSVRKNNNNNNHDSNSLDEKFDEKLKEKLHENSSTSSISASQKRLSSTKQNIDNKENMQTEDKLLDNSVVNSTPLPKIPNQTPEAKRKNTNDTPPATPKGSAGTPILTNFTSKANTNSSTADVTAPNLSTNQRQSAVTLVGDLLNKIGVLENKLSSCRKFIRDSPWRESYNSNRKLQNGLNRVNGDVNPLNLTPKMKNKDRVDGRPVGNN